MKIPKCREKPGRGCLYYLSPEDCPLNKGDNCAVILDGVPVQDLKGFFEKAIEIINQNESEVKKDDMER